ncbi:helix-turn-helix domain-containing protein [Flammeovirga yaeyamensis]|uniref:Helix-turn-helix domain-containing protein n=1 Tax=Flammeovirga yaeyamensis TaxID=367791 RepID=A0AAX1N9K4_9BACT|nr:AraC family transcriptional regulator [Flammeovirga yaeyamensis]MBB3699386.1 AraC-like DNA-binding protein [Flammeovirga yaeyamensis]NMF35354.1 helix-turn-helix transcriptional regulator [Flammeovirga yaeyamensis]QWG04214.1 helix-turn-helix domain-containing protein [Flammeovirga yaeyamensis]
MIINRESFDLHGKAVMEKVKFTPPFKANTKMENEACFLHILKGEAELYVPQEKLSVQSSDSLFMKCGAYMNFWKENKDETQNEAILVHLYPETLQSIYANQLPSFLSENKGKKHSTAEKLKISSMIENYISSLNFYFENPSIVTDELIQLKVKELLLLLVNSHFSENLSHMFSDLFSPVNLDFKNMIETHLYEDISVQDYASIAGMSLSTFKRKFQSIYDCSPKRYINQKRLEKAKDLLMNTDLRVSNIAYDCGFNDISYFSKSFHAQFNSSPSDYRKKNH